MTAHGFPANLSSIARRRPRLRISLSDHAFTATLTRASCKVVVFVEQSSFRSRASLPRLIDATALFVVNKGARRQVWQSSWKRKTSAGLLDESTSRPTSDQPASVLTSVPDAVLPSQTR